MHRVIPQNSASCFSTNPCLVTQLPRVKVATVKEAHLVSSTEGTPCCTTQMQQEVVCASSSGCGAVRTTASSSTDCNTGYHWPNLLVDMAHTHVVGTNTPGCPKRLRWDAHTRGRTRCTTQLVRTNGRGRDYDVKGSLVRYARRHRATPCTIRHHVCTIHSSPV